MAIEGGENLADLSYNETPMDDFGRHFDPFTGDYFVGNLPADFSGMQIFNPQPGKGYLWAANTANDMLHFANKYGAEIVGPEDPERVGMGRLAQISKVHTGAQKAYGDVVLMRYDQAEYDLVRRRQFEEHRDALDGVVANFKDSDPAPHGRSTRYDNAQGNRTGLEIEDLPNRG